MPSDAWKSRNSGRVLWRRSVKLVALLLLAVVCSPTVRAEELKGGVTKRPVSCAVVDAQPCVVTLNGSETGSARSPSCQKAPWTSYLRFAQDDADRNHDGYLESVLAIDLDPAKGCRCVFASAHIKAGTGYVLHIGDSPTNDCHGGDHGTSRHDAELEIVGNKLGVYGRDLEPTRGQFRGIERILQIDLPPAIAYKLRIEVCDQVIRLQLTDAATGETRLDTHLETPLSQRLFSLAGQDVSPRMGDPDHRDYTLWMAFNRIVASTDGAPFKDRYGSGVMSVTLSLSP